MFDSDREGASATAQAFATHALVPYLGILFCPGALVMGSVGVWQSCRRPQPDGRGAGYSIIVVGLVVLSGQLLLWWLLYKVPEWSSGF